MRTTVLLVLLLSASACQNPPPQPADVPDPAQPEYAPSATIKDIMMSIVDPAADVVWLSVTTVQSSAGTVDAAPKSDEDWANVRKGAVTLTEAANLLMMPGRHVARAHEKSDTPGVELEPSQMEELINKDRAAWEMRARNLHDAGVAALQAIDAKDAQKVFEVGEQIEVACENCHKQYWYTNEKIPEFPSSAQ
jgi:hypothetical protein